jgi:hypothetical protein
MWIQIGTWKVRTFLTQHKITVGVTDENGLFLNYDKIILLLLCKVSKGISSVILTINDQCPE